ncbi:uncharacterized protein ARMOST_21789 [Armillaria ostoyae]|uniref:Uncharacterized protein n=1 Tax=Armillaria ostoyae TaxID=47428 RepID=A0A284SB20_ARMOS|nr:uncharacterized protein ARMOST_21789 [Armillaria ostoyae]
MGAALSGSGAVILEQIAAVRLNPLLGSCLRTDLERDRRPFAMTCSYSDRSPARGRLLAQAKQQCCIDRCSCHVDEIAQWQLLESILFISP